MLAVVAAIAVMAFAALGPSAGVASASDASPCDPERPHASGAFPDTIESGGLTREYVLHVPTSYDGSAAVPLFLNLHAFASNIKLQDNWSELPGTGEQEGFIVVTPNGHVLEGGFRHWNSGQQPAPEADDVAFLGELLTAMESLLCIDSSRMYSTGLSNGAFMSSRLACSIPDRIAGIAPVAGATFYGDCTADPVPVIAFHGTADPIVDFAPIEDTAMPAWATHNGCAAPTEQDPLPGTVGVRLVRYSGCDDDATVELYAIFDADTDTVGEQGGGHTWPGSGFVIVPALEAIVGIATQEISANDLMWDFFSANVPIKQNAVGGIAQDAELRALPLDSADSSGQGVGVLVVIVMGVATVALALGGVAGLRLASASGNSSKKR